ncbi:MAG: hypothetical protein QGG50_01475 [Methanopyri archaeon]|nr:hypothetical protein [Methanopyri archaeon]
MRSFRGIAHGVARALISTGMMSHGILGDCQRVYGDLLVLTGGVIGHRFGNEHPESYVDPDSELLSESFED